MIKYKRIFLIMVLFMHSLFLYGSSLVIENQDTGNRIQGYEISNLYKAYVNNIISQMATAKGAGALFSVAGRTAGFRDNLITTSEARLDWQGRTANGDYNFQIQTNGRTSKTIAAVIIKKNVMDYIVEYRQAHHQADIEALERGLAGKVGAAFVESSRNGHIFACEGIRR